MVVYLTWLRHATRSFPIARMLGHLQTVLEGMVASPERQLAKLPLLTPQTQCIHQLFEEQVDRTTR